MKEKTKVHRYFRLEDLVINPDIWGRKLYVVHGFGGNAYCPELYVYKYREVKNISNSCNWNVRMTVLIDSPSRPFHRLKKTQLLKLLKTGSDKTKEEVKREMLIRTNRKLYGFI